MRNASRGAYRKCVGVGGYISAGQRKRAADCWAAVQCDSVGIVDGQIIECVAVVPPIA